MRILAVVNLEAGGGSDVGLYDFVRSVGLHGAEVTLRFMGNEDLKTLVNDATAFDRIVAVGGDGTVSAVCYETRGSKVPVLAYPAGTANLLAENLDLPLDPFSLARIALDDCVIDLDLGELTYTKAHSTHVVGFSNVAGAGFDAHVMDAARQLKPTFGPAAYVVGAVQNLVPSTSHFKLTCDDDVYTFEGIGVLVINIPRLPFDITLAEGAHPADGWFDVAALRSRSVVNLIPALLNAMFDNIADYAGRSEDVDFYRARFVRVEADPPQPLQYDGEVLDARTPFEARMLPHASRLLVPSDSPLLAAEEEQAD